VAFVAAPASFLRYEVAGLSTLVSTPIHRAKQARGVKSQPATGWPGWSSANPEPASQGSGWLRLPGRSSM